jgi:hypothetical protein
MEWPRVAGARLRALDTKGYGSRATIAGELNFGELPKGELRRMPLLMPSFGKYSLGFPTPPNLTASDEFAVNLERGGPRC